MPEIQIDDIHPYLFSAGGDWWQELDYGNSYNRTRSLTRTYGAYRTVRFVGMLRPMHLRTSGAHILECRDIHNRVWGDAAYETDGDRPLRVQFSIDNGASTIYGPHVTEWYYTAAMYYQSPALEMGEHVLTIRNMVQNDMLWLDYFVIQALSGGNPELLESDGSFTPSRPTPTPSSTIRSESSTSPSTVPFSTSQDSTTTSSSSSQISETSDTTRLNRDSPSLTASPSSRTGDQSAHALITSALPVTTYQTMVVNAQNNPSSAPSKTVIALASRGAVAVIMILTLILLFLSKRRVKNSKYKNHTTRSHPHHISPTIHDHLPKR